VGRASVVWIDQAHIDVLAPVPKTNRELVVWIWYPAADATLAAATEDYFPDSWRTAAEQYWGELGKFLERDLALVQVHSLRDARISQQQAAYPVVIMRAGLSALTLEYTSLAEDLASHGYIVVGFDAPYRTQLVALPDGSVVYRAAQNDPESFDVREGERIAAKLVAAWTADTAFVLDQLAKLNASDPAGKLTGRLDLLHVGVFGHSLGGATAAEFCHDDARCKAGIDIDGAPYGSVVEEELPKPFMFLMSDHSHETDVASQQIEANIQSIYDRLPHGTRQRIVIRGANHFGFSDAAVLKSQIVQGMLRALGIVGIEGRRQLAITSHCVHSFFDAYLMDAIATTPTMESDLYPEIKSLK
jgi:dienelactone hydrolase